MGVPKFYRWLSERYPLINQSIDNNQFNIPIDNLYLDVNGIIHNATHSGHEIRAKPTDIEVATAVVAYIDTIVSLAQPKKLLYIAVDGVPPRAKVNQQRKRRFRAARELQEDMQAKKSNSTTEYFDSNCITPGTEFMQNLDQNLEYMIAYKIETDHLWHHLQVVYSGYNVPGEGEHKLAEFIREQKRSNQMNPKIRHCIYGLDADLILLSLSFHLPNFVLLREQIDFLSFNNVSKVTTRDIKAKKWQFMHISILREYLEKEFSDQPFQCDPERVIDDFIFLVTLCGNDFIPELPSLDIKQGSLDKMLEIYKILLSTSNGQYIIRDGMPNIAVMKQLFIELGEIEDESMQQIQEASQKSHKYAKGGQKQKFSEEDSKRNEVLRKLGKGASTKTIYYYSKFNIEKKNVNQKQEIIQAYLDGLFWVFNYYYRGCPSWNWFYPYHYAPMFSDLADLIDSYKSKGFTVGRPVDPFIQLLCCLPPQSAQLLPTVFHGLMTDKSSPIIQYYPETFSIDPNGKSNDWEGVELIPFIDIDQILKAVETIKPNDHINEKERKRSINSYMNVFYQHDPMIKPYPLSSVIPSIFPSLTHCHVHVKKMKMELPSPKNKPIISPKYYKCLREDSPSLNSLSCNSYLDFIAINIFGVPSRKESMVLEIAPHQLNHTDVTQYLGYHCSCGYPSKFPGVITKILFPTKQFYYKQCFNKNQTLIPKFYYHMIDEPLAPREKDLYSKKCHRLIDDWLTGFPHQLGTGGIKLLEISCLFEINPIIGVLEVDGASFWQYSSQTVTYPYELIVLQNTPPLDLPQHSIAEKFPINEQVLVIDQVTGANNTSLFGKQGEVVSIDVSDSSVTVDLKLSPFIEPSFGYNLVASTPTEWTSLQQASKQLQVSPDGLLCILGNVIFDKEFDVGLGMMTHKNNQWFVSPGYVTMKYNKQVDCWKDARETSLLIAGQYSQSDSSNDLRGIQKSCLLSPDAIAIMSTYFHKYPDIIDLIEQGYCSYFDSRQVWGKDGHFYIEEIIKWRNNLPHISIRSIESTSSLFTSDQIQVLNAATKVIKSLEQSVECITLRVTLSQKQLIGESELFSNTKCECAKPMLGSRVISLGRTNVPLGFKGTVVGLHPNSGFIEVVYDQDFLSGTSLNGLCRSGYGKVSSYEDVLNISS